MSASNPPYQGLVETLKESERLVERVRDIQKKTKPFFDGLEQLSTVTEKEWLMLYDLALLGEEVTKMSDDVQHLASTVEPVIPEAKINLNLPSSLQLQLEEDTQVSERHMEEKESFRKPVVHKRAHRPSSSSSVSVEPLEKHSQEETSSENSHSPHSNRGSKHE